MRNKDYFTISMHVDDCDLSMVDKWHVFQAIMPLSTEFDAGVYLGCFNSLLTLYRNNMVEKEGLLPIIEKVNAVYHHSKLLTNDSKQHIEGLFSEFLLENDNQEDVDRSKTSSNTYLSSESVELHDQINRLLPTGTQLNRLCTFYFA